jgi:hypothetical protein
MRRDSWQTLIAASVMALLVGCARDDAAARSRLLDDVEARRLVGTWVVLLWLDPAQTTTTKAHPVAPVAGTLVFAEDHYGRIASTELSGATHDGVYDVDFRPFGFSSRDESAVPVVVARVDPRAKGDSLYVVLSPGTPRFAVRMAGTIVGDSAAGAWRAAAFSAGGGGGRFIMRRRQDTP